MNTEAVCTAWICIHTRNTSTIQRRSRERYRERERKEEDYLFRSWTAAVVVFLPSCFSSPAFLNTHTCRLRFKHCHRVSAYIFNRFRYVYIRHYVPVDENSYGLRPHEESRCVQSRLVVEKFSRIRGSEVGWQRGYVGRLFIWRGLVVGVAVFERRSEDGVF